jgi:hypothetical protein
MLFAPPSLFGEKGRGERNYFAMRGDRRETSHRFAPYPLYTASAAKFWSRFSNQKRKVVYTAGQRSVRAARLFPQQRAEVRSTSAKKGKISNITLRSEVLGKKQFLNRPTIRRVMLRKVLNKRCPTSSGSGQQRRAERGSRRDPPFLFCTKPKRPYGVLGERCIYF